MIYKTGFAMITLCVATMARPQEPHPAPQVALQQQQRNPGDAVTPIAIISQTESIDANGAFNFSYETGNGIKVEEAAFVKHVTGLRARGNFAADDKTQPDEDDVLVQTGSFSYTAPDGQVISLRYTADENGFQPVGDHLPTPPPVPADILRSLPQQDALPGAQQVQQPAVQQVPQPAASATQQTTPAPLPPPPNVDVIQP